MRNDIAVNPIAGACGAEIDGVDLSQPMDDGTFQTVERALLDHQVIFFRNQRLTPEQQKAFGRRFGELRISDQYQPIDGHPEILEIVKEPDATGIVGMDMKSARELFDTLLVHALHTSNIYSHRWRNGDVVLWDNARLLHRREAFASHTPRFAKRTTVHMDPKYFAVAHGALSDGGG